MDKYGCIRSVNHISNILTFSRCYRDYFALDHRSRDSLGMVHFQEKDGASRRHEEKEKREKDEKSKWRSYRTH